MAFPIDFPIDWATYGAFLLTASAIVLTPGPDTLIILRYSLSSGRNVGLATVAGVQFGLVGHTLLAIFGISVIIASTPILFKGVALAGAAYIGWIGIQGFRKHGLLHVGAQGKPPVSAKKALIDAIFCNLLNPKVILLFLALFPNFVDNTRDDVTLQLIALSLGLITINIIWQAPMAFAAEAVRRWLKNETIYKWITHSTGVLMITIAVLMVYENLM
ncbi:MAG: LysE family translocator [Magnetovibrio sp.]|nr:LysE family translocator [Magnetovibrio sp.]